MDVRTPNFNGKKGLRKARTPRYISKTRYRRPNPKRRKLLSVLLIFVVIGLIATLSHQIASNLFKVKNISITGCRRVSQQDILDKLNIEIGEKSILEVSIPEVKEKLKELDFVKDVSVSKKVIGGILEINLSEREAIAAVENSTEDGVEYLLIDSEGILLEVVNKDEKPKEIVTIVDVEDLSLNEFGRQLEIESVNLALSIIKESKQKGLDSEILAINANNSNKIAIQLKNKLLVFISAKSMNEGLENISLVLKDKRHSKQFYKNGGYLDARFEEVVYKGG